MVQWGRFRKTVPNFREHVKKGGKRLLPTAHPHFTASSEATHKGANKEFLWGGLHDGLHLYKQNCLQ